MCDSARPEWVKGLVRQGVGLGCNVGMNLSPHSFVPAWLEYCTTRRGDVSLCMHAQFVLEWARRVHSFGAKNGIQECTMSAEVGHNDAQFVSGRVIAMRGLVSGCIAGMRMHRFV